MLRAFQLLPERGHRKHLRLMNFEGITYAHRHLRHRPLRYSQIESARVMLLLVL